MSALDDLIKQIPNDNRRKFIDSEFKKLRATKKFDLVFDVPIKKNSFVAKKFNSTIFSKSYRLTAKI